MLRRVLIVLALLVVALSACGGNDDDNNDANPNPTTLDSPATAPTNTPPPAAVADDDTSADDSQPPADESTSALAMTATESAYLGLGNLISRAIAPDEQTLALGTGVGVLFYDLNDLSAAPRRVPMLGAATQVIYSPDGTHLAVRQAAPSGFNIPTEFIVVLEVATGETLASVDTFQDPVQALHYSADGTLLVGEIQDTVTVWDALTLGPLHEFVLKSETMGSIIATRISPDNTRLALMRQNGMEIVDIATGAATLSLPSDSRLIEAYIEWVDNERVVHTALAGGATTITDLSAPDAEPVQVAQVSPSGGMELRGEALYLTGAFNAGVYDLTGANPFRRVEVGYATISATAAVWVNQIGDALIFYDADGTETARLDAYNFEGVLALNDGTLLVMDDERFIQIDPTTPAVTAVLEIGLRGGNATPTLTSDGAFTAIVDRTDSANQMTHILDTQTGLSVSSFAYPYTSADTLAFSAEGQRLAIGGRDSEGPVLSVWQDAALLWELHGEDNFTGLSFTPDGSGLWVGSRAGVSLYDAATGEPTGASLDLQGKSGVATVRYAPAEVNRLVVLGDTSTWNAAYLGIYDATTYDLIRFIPDAHHYAVKGAVFVGDTVLTVGRDTRLRQWSLMTGGLVAEGVVFDDAMAALYGLSDDGTRLVTLSDHHILQLWEWTAGE